MGVGVAREVQPIACHVLAVGRALHQASDQVFQRPGGVVREKGVYFLRSGRQSSEIQVDTSNECFGPGQRRGLQAFLRQTLLQEGVNRICHPLGHRGRLRSCEGPVIRIRRTLQDPLLQDVLFRIGKFLMRIRGGHHLILVF